MGEGFDGVRKRTEKDTVSKKLRACGGEWKCTSEPELEGKQKTQAEDFKHRKYCEYREHRKHREHRTSLPTTADTATCMADSGR
ncbi:hypothetical protein GJ744_011901 [Endocarpon pusillum]|uniref:Uncharacterized protein n=1 Tax=Endocarpon pusillum TaxID=364733 RepID=A0A8H7ABZ1_9EURO|nr:hypothetical protein GJ744_011901 [Endocarpon pusillum]